MYFLTFSFSSSRSYLCFKQDFLASIPSSYFSYVIKKCFFEDDVRHFTINLTSGERVDYLCDDEIPRSLSFILCSTSSFSFAVDFYHGQFFSSCVS